MREKAKQDEKAFARSALTVSRCVFCSNLACAGCGRLSCRGWWRWLLCCSSCILRPLRAVRCSTVLEHYSQRRSCRLGGLGLHRGRQVGISHRRTELVIRWTEEMATSEDVHLTAFEQGLGRILYAVGALTRHPRGSVRRAVFFRCSHVESFLTTARPVPPLFVRFVYIPSKHFSTSRRTSKQRSDEHWWAFFQCWTNVEYPTSQDLGGSTLRSRQHIGRGCLRRAGKPSLSLSTQPR